MADGVRDLGHRFLKPEIQWADELLSNIEQGEDTTNLAEAKVVAALKARIEEVQADDWALNLAQKEEFTCGIPGQRRILRRGSVESLSLDSTKAECGSVKCCATAGITSRTSYRMNDCGPQPGGLRFTFLNEPSCAVAEPLLRRIAHRAAANPVLVR